MTCETCALKTRVSMEPYERLSLPLLWKPSGLPEISNPTTTAAASRCSPRAPFEAQETETTVVEVGSSIRDPISLVKTLFCYFRVHRTAKLLMHMLSSSRSSSGHFFGLALLIRLRMIDLFCSLLTPLFQKSRRDKRNAP